MCAQCEHCSLIKKNRLLMHQTFIYLFTMGAILSHLPMVTHQQLELHGSVQQIDGMTLSLNKWTRQWKKYIAGMAAHKATALYFYFFFHLGLDNSIILIDMSRWRTTSLLLDSEHSLVINRSKNEMVRTARRNFVKKNISSTR